MSIIDIITVLIFIPFLVSGIRKGLIEQAFSLVALVAGAWMAFRFSSLLAGWAAPKVNASPEVLAIVAFAVIIILSIIVFALIGKGIKAVCKLALLGWLDRTLGALLGLAKAALVCGILIILFSTLNDKFAWVPKEDLEASVFYAPLKELAYGVFPYFKEFIAKV